MPSSNIHGDRTYYDSVSFRGTTTLPDDTIVDAKINSDADIQYDKVQHVHHLSYSQADGSAVTTAEVPIYMPRASGTVLAVEACLLTAAVGDSTVAIDVEWSDAAAAFASILSSALSLTSSTAVRTPTAATLSGTPTYDDGDMFMVSVTATAGTGTLPQGLIVTMTVAEKGQ